MLFLTCVIFLSCNKKDADIPYIPEEWQVVVNIPDGYPVITEHPQSNVYFVHEARDPLIVNVSVSKVYTLSFQWYYRSYPIYTGRERIEQEAATEIDKIINENFEDMIYGKKDGYSPPPGMLSRTYPYSSKSDSIWVYFCVVTSTYMYGSKTFTAASDPAVITILKHPLSAWQTVDRRLFVDSYSTSRRISSYIDFNDVTYGNGYFAAVGDNGNIAYSSDGETWNTVKFGTDINAVAYGNGRFAAVGDNGNIAYSSNGETWTLTANRSFGNFKSIAYGNGRFIANSSSGIAYSSDGETWFAMENIDDVFVRNISCRIIYNDGRFIAGSRDGKIAFSNDGETWSAIEDDAFDSYSIVSIAYGNSRFVVYAKNYNGVKMAYSDDGETWDIIRQIERDDKYYEYWNWIESITYGDGCFISVGEDKIDFSEDGVGWPTLEEGNPYNSDRRHYTAVAYGGGFFAIVGDDGMVRVCQWPLTKVKAPVIIRHPITATYDLDSHANALSVSAANSGYGVLSVQWYRNDTDSNANGTPIEGADRWSYTPDTAKAGTTYYYVPITKTIPDIFNIREENKTASITSNTAAIIVNAPGQTVMEAQEK